MSSDDCRLVRRVSSQSDGANHELDTFCVERYVNCDCDISYCTEIVCIEIVFYIIEKAVRPTDNFLACFTFLSTSGDERVF